VVDNELAVVKTLVAPIENKRVKCIRGPSTCKKVSLRFINFGNAF
jgi:hypothetical protein